MSRYYIVWIHKLFRCQHLIIRILLFSKLFPILKNRHTPIYNCNEKHIKVIKKKGRNSLIIVKHCPWVDCELNCMLFIKTACYIDVQNSSIPRSQEPVVFPRFIRNASYSYVISLRHIRKQKYDVFAVELG